MPPLSSEEVRKYQQEFETQDAEAVLKWAYARFGGRVVLASSFSREDMILMDLAVKIRRNPRIVTLDTGRLPEETHRIMDDFRKKYGVAIEAYFPDKDAVEALVKKKGFYSFRESLENRKECCQIRKVEPLARALRGADAWITGQRRDQAVTRVVLNKIEPDFGNTGLVKFNPLADWDEARIVAYVKEKKLPYNVLYDQGYRSIGCAPCTRAVAPGEDERAGRWWWENPGQKECGIHRR